MEETQVLAKSTAYAHVARAMVGITWLQYRIEPERYQAPHRLIEDLRVGIRDTENPAAVATFRVEDPREKAEAPARSGIDRP